MFKWLFHRHVWKLVSANISSKLFGFAAVATLECEDCGKREFFSQGMKLLDDQFPSKNAARVWVESLLPPGHRNLTLEKSKRIDEE